MKSAHVSSRMDRIFVMMMLTAFLTLFGNMAFAEMRVITHDGRTHTVPVQADEINRIEFSAQGQAVSSHRLLGCYKDQGDPQGTRGRDLSGFVRNDPGMTTEKCVSLCRVKGFRYAGTQYSSWCFCGNSYGKSGRADNCTMKCSGNQAQTCGGSWANSVYAIE